MKRFVFIALSLILLASQFHLTIGTHFCGGEAVMSKLIITTTTLDCNMEAMNHSTDKATTLTLSYTHPPCCENHYQTIQTTDNFVNDAQTSIIHLDFVAALVYSILTLDEVAPSADHFYADYSPPPLEKNLQILFQTFII